MPTDPSPRLLELLVLLDQHWSFKQTSNKQRGGANWNYPLCVVSRTAQDMLSFARSLIEWMGGVVRDSGTEEAELMDRRKGKGGKKGRRQKVEAGSEYGALDFK
jgi:cleavage and polyadenylation specificity factor subunit 2